MSQATPPTKKRKENRREFEKRLINQRASSKGFLQSRQMGKAIKKDWDTDIADVRNLFAYLLVWINPIRIQAKVREHSHQLLVNWIYFMWETMMSKALNEFIRREDIRRKIEWHVKENTALNIVHDFLKDGHLDEEMQLLIRMNHNFYRFIYSATINIIYFNTNEIHIQERFLEKYSERRSNAQGGWLSLSPLVNQHRCMGLPNPQVMQYPPLPNNVVVQSEKIDPPPLTEQAKNDILKKQKQTLENELLKRKIEQMDAIKRQHKIARQDFLKNKKIRKM